jgi:ubiquinone/menaquinone biosynthesis C-methylase UbiE
MENCTNCDNDNTEKLNETARHEYSAVMSDGSIANDFNASQNLCKNCGSIFINYYPSNRLEQFFSDSYDVSDEVQDCQIVVSGKKSSKHSVIHKSLLNFCAQVPSNGYFLEIACGNGILSSKYADKHTKWECIAVDPSRNSGKMISKRVRFVNDFFDPSLFESQKFDVIVAHGILNRTPTIKILDNICKVAAPNAIISLEIVTLENSIFAPYIWDHSYTFLEETFCEYLNSSGIIIIKRVDCGSTIQFLCKYKGEEYNKLLSIKESTIESTYKLYFNHLHLWDEIKTKFLKNLSLCKKEKVNLFGAGLYSAVLLSLIDPAKINSVIDEIRTGSFVYDIKIINLEKAAEAQPKIPVFICARPRNKLYIKEKLEARGFSVVLL